LKTPSFGSKVPFAPVSCSICCPSSSDFDDSPPSAAETGITTKQATALVSANAPWKVFTPEPMSPPIAPAQPIAESSSG
jgi:hypothetical protein